ncbi:hypothetical protein Tco_1402852 [Tanacetum coccineum]
MGPIDKVPVPTGDCSTLVLDRCGWNSTCLEVEELGVLGKLLREKFFDDRLSLQLLSSSRLVSSLLMCNMCQRDDILEANTSGALVGVIIKVKIEWSRKLLSDLVSNKWEAQRLFWRKYPSHVPSEVAGDPHLKQTIWHCCRPTPTVLGQVAKLLAQSVILFPSIQSPFSIAFPAWSLASDATTTWSKSESGNPPNIFQFCQSLQGNILSTAMLDSWNRFAL